MMRAWLLSLCAFAALSFGTAAHAVTLPSSAGKGSYSTTTVSANPTTTCFAGSSMVIGVTSFGSTTGGMIVSGFSSSEDAGAWSAVDWLPSGGTRPTWIFVKHLIADFTTAQHIDFTSNLAGGGTYTMDCLPGTTVDGPNFGKTDGTPSSGASGTPAAAGYIWGAYSSTNTSSLSPNPPNNGSGAWTTLSNTQTGSPGTNFSIMTYYKTTTTTPETFSFTSIAAPILAVTGQLFDLTGGGSGPVNPHGCMLRGGVC